MKNKKIALIGLGYVGLPLAVEFGKKREVVGFDINKNRIDQLEKGIDPTLELTKEELKASIHLSYTTNLDDLKDCSIFIAVKSRSPKDLDIFCPFVPYVFFPSVRTPSTSNII